MFLLNERRETFSVLDVVWYSASK